MAALKTTPASESASPTQLPENVASLTQLPEKKSGSVSFWYQNSAGEFVVYYDGNFVMRTQDWRNVLTHAFDSKSSLSFSQEKHCVLGTPFEGGNPVPPGNWSAKYQFEQSSILKQTFAGPTQEPVAGPTQQKV